MGRNQENTGYRKQNAGSVYQFRMVDQLQELELGDITDIIDTDRKNAMREDVPVESFDKETILANAPCVECGGVSVPRVVE